MESVNGGHGPPTLRWVAGYMAKTSRRQHPKQVAAETGRLLIQIVRGIYLSTAVFDGIAEPWKIRRIIELSRIIAAAMTYRDAVVIGESAALVHGLYTYELSGDVHLLVPTRPGKAVPTMRTIRLESCRTQGGVIYWWEQRSGESVTASLAREGSQRQTVHVKMARIRRHSSRSFMSERPRQLNLQMGRALPSGHRRSPRCVILRCTSVNATALTAALTAPLPCAFAMMCGALNRTSGFKRSVEHRSRKQEGRVRETWLRAIRQLPKGFRRRRWAEWICRHSDAGCESTGEAALMWVLKSGGCTGLTTQVRSPADRLGGRFYIDVALEKAKVAIEFDGYAKYGDNRFEVSDSYAQQMRRQHILEKRGWIVVRVTWSDLFHPDHVIGKVWAAVEQRSRLYEAVKRGGRPRRQVSNDAVRS